MNPQTGETPFAKRFDTVPELQKRQRTGISSVRCLHSSPEPSVHNSPGSIFSVLYTRSFKLMCKFQIA